MRKNELFFSLEGEMKGRDNIKDVLRIKKI